MRHLHPSLLFLVRSFVPVVPPLTFEAVSSSEGEWRLDTRAIACDSDTQPRTR